MDGLRIGRRVVRIWLVEFIQNLPFASAFLYGAAWIEAGRAWAAAAWVLAGTAAGVCLIRYTEAFIEPGEMEKPAETLANLVFFSIAIAGFILYFSFSPGSWLTDLSLACAAGVSLAVIQARAAGTPVSARHAAALTFSFSAAVLLIRFWALGVDPLIGSSVLAAAVTTIIVRIEYSSVTRDR